MIRFFHAATALVLLTTLPFTATAEVRPKAGSRDARVTYANFVEGQVYHVSTRIRNITLIELGQGEEIRSVAAGDLESFQIDKLEGANVFTIKPVIEGASTNVTVETNRRFYFLQVSESRATPNWSVKFNAPGDGRSNRAAPSVRPLPTAPPKKMRYAVSRGSSGADFAPVGVSDDGQKTYFQIPPGAPMPSLFRVDSKGREYSVNSSTKAEIITVAARSERWVLRYGDDYICINGQEE
ncbi:TrbG/VirB9 family P-type conjugative transfer protein [Paracoccus sp. MBLB3053]|uniref:TrbG/VirB9 family P-type conjugative transfer protein n=1 Tax=Paracoccus aurantius TaxID=3073814 RepID=A0ABU2HYV2_9RHOB|nr:TrbG/VirB9 family P-type conjugative transfer protein [Paracoccus sp. MBLB3053]MDS9470247.1 TrbG/VirB9 family P-type conjugative transfer protein [Paracoccus sp. MBLB3053]